MRLPWTFSTFDYRELCGLLWDQSDAATFETAKVEGRTGTVVHTDRGDLSAPLVVDGLGWRRVLGGRRLSATRRAALTRARGPPWGASDELEIWIDRGYVPAGYGWSFPAADEVRVGVGSFDPRHHVKEPTVRLARDLDHDAVRYQGNWIPHQLRPAAVDGIFLAGDSAGPLPAADGRGDPHRALLRDRLRARAARRRRGPQGPRAGAARLRVLLCLAPVEVRGDAARPATGAAGRAPPAGPDAPRHGAQAVRGLVVRPLPRDRAAQLRGPAPHPLPRARSPSRLRPSRLSGRSGTSRRAAGRRPACAPR